jgi:general secretion pathway protein A
MYESFFGLNEKPFNLTPDPRYFYMSESHREALAALIYGVREKSGLITVTGPVGVGKTMILASFLDEIREEADTASFSGSISGDRRGFLLDLARSLEVPAQEDSLFGLSRSVKDFAVRKVEEGRSVVVLVDEAQDLGLEELEHFHHLSNLETPDTKLIQIVLAGTEKLDEKLRDRNLEALWQRIAIRCAIKPIEPEETMAYIFHRIRVAGGGSSGLLSDDALWRILNYSRGVPRLINRVCNQAMISAYSAGRLPVDEDAVLEALRELEGGQPGVGTVEVVARDAVREMAAAVARREEQGSSPLEREKHCGPSETENLRGKAEPDRAQGGGVPRDESWQSVVKPDRAQGVAPRDESRQGFFARFRPPMRISLSLALVVLLATVGVVMTIGLLKAREDGTEKDGSAALDASEAKWAGAAGRQTKLGHGIPRGGPEQTLEDGRPARQAVVRKDEEPLSGGDGPVRKKGLARIALQRYGRLDLDVLKILREKNPRIRDWNNLDRNVHLLLPDVPETGETGVDVYTIQVGAFREEGGASRRASDLAKSGAQNLFLVKGGVDQKYTFVCVGVFESGRQSQDGLGTVQAWGYPDAFPLRIQAESLQDILFAFKTDLTDPAAAP